MEQDEDLIPYYHCTICDGKVCKGDVGSFLNGRDVVCIDCEEEK